ASAWRRWLRSPSSGTAGTGAETGARRDCLSGRSAMSGLQVALGGVEELPALVDRVLPLRRAVEVLEELVELLPVLLAEALAAVRVGLDARGPAPPLGRGVDLVLVRRRVVRVRPAGADARDLLERLVALVADRGRALGARLVE